jgi:transposase
VEGGGKAIICRLKSGTQWREIPLRQHFGFSIRTWQAVFYHFNKWSKDGSWENLWTKLLELHRSALDMSSVQLDGSHTRARLGGKAVGYQKRKSSKTTNMLFLTDRMGIPLAASEPMAGNHHDLFEIKENFSKMDAGLKRAGIATEGLFLNADAIHSPNEHYGLFNYFKGIETIPYYYQYYTELKGRK